MTAAAYGRESTPVRVAATAAFSYELVALWTDLPTITRLTRKWPPLGASILVGLTLHFYPPRRTR